MEQLKKWKELFKENSIKWTRQRELIIKILLKADRPLSANELLIQINELGDEVRLSTIYRNLNTFSEFDIVEEFEFSGQKKFELGQDQHHHHLLCLSCEEILPLECPLEEYEKEIKQDTKYDILKHNMKLYGICPDCQKD